MISIIIGLALAGTLLAVIIGIMEARLDFALWAFCSVFFFPVFACAFFFSLVGHFCFMGYRASCEAMDWMLK